MILVFIFVNLIILAYQIVLLLRSTHNLQMSFKATGILSHLVIRRKVVHNNNNDNNLNFYDDTTCSSQ